MDSFDFDYQKPGLEFFCQLNVKVDKPHVVGETAYGIRKIIPIIGGQVFGPSIKGEILNGGADWQIVRKDGVAVLDAKYQFKTDDGTIIYVNNEALRVASPEVTERIAKGESVDSSQYYFRGTPKFEAPAGNYEWINNSIFICSGERKPDEVIIKVWKVL